MTAECWSRTGVGASTSIDAGLQRAPKAAPPGHQPSVGSGVSSAGMSPLGCVSGRRELPVLGRGASAPCPGSRAEPGPGVGWGAPGFKMPQGC